ncbi:hypothetical protein QBC35DRAFT_448584 [Podospora australis]|uniref:Uncharacterized protein n=1 Tax=Podospora australis TaxID=1536484 RepID=A0AAN6X127_9PEZI|nr:hypothetical protein QBC35DRAFT_448584 [Podospora australis]
MEPTHHTIEAVTLFSMILNRYQASLDLGEDQAIFFYVASTVGPAYDERPVHAYLVEPQPVGLVYLEAGLRGSGSVLMLVYYVPMWFQTVKQVDPINTPTSEPIILAGDQTTWESSVRLTSPRRRLSFRSSLPSSPLMVLRFTAPTRLGTLSKNKLDVFRP